MAECAIDVVCLAGSKLLRGRLQHGAGKGGGIAHEGIHHLGVALRAVTVKRQRGDHIQNAVGHHGVGLLSRVGVAHL